MSAVGITENAKGDNKKFEIWCNSREEVYIVQVRWRNRGDMLCFILIVNKTHEIVELEPKPDRASLL